jgi:Ca2+-binding EF-hand superfamily protein
MFALHDLDGGGSIEVNELEQLLFKLGLDKNDAPEMMRLYDPDGSGGIDVDEFTVMIAQSHCKRQLSQLTKTKEAELRKVFESIDEDSGGSIDAEEMGIAMRRQGIDMSAKDLEETISGYDDDGSGRIGFPEFCKMMLLQQGDSGKRVDVHLFSLAEKENFAEIFDSINKTGSGEIGLAEFGQAMVQAGVEITPAEVSNVFEAFDEDNSGTIDLQVSMETF